MTHKWIKQSPLHRVDGEDIEEGEVFEPTEAELQSFGDVIVEAKTRGSDAEDGDVETCEVVMTNGDVCGRELPCSYHSD